MRGCAPGILLSVHGRTGSTDPAAARDGTTLPPRRSELTATVVISGSRWAPLDGIRAVAILLVVAYHTGLPLLAGGGLGVTVFFVLSGYLITMLLLRASTMDRRQLWLFYARRLLRLYPALVLLVLVCVAYAFLVLEGPNRDYLLWQSLWSVTYMQDFVLASRERIDDYGYLGHTWSLAVEEQFYLVWPLLLMAMSRAGLSDRRRLHIVLALTATAAGWRTYLSAAGLPNRVGLGFDGNAEALLVGCSLAFILPMTARDGRAAKIVRSSMVIGIAAFPLLVLAPRSLPYDSGRLVAALITAVVIADLVLAPHSRLARAAGWWPLAQVGVVSYSLYLVHPVALHMLEDAVGLETTGERVLWAVPAAAIIAAATWASYRYVELPFLRLKDRLGSSRTPVADPGAPPVPGTIGPRQS